MVNKKHQKQTSIKRQSRHRNQKTKRSSKLGQIFVLLMLVVGGLSGGLNSYYQYPSQVLAYATNVNHNGLLTSTNQNRTANGLNGLTINGRLNSAAQAKANDMVAKDYWSHTSPDGRQPWDFIISAGYSYSTAGENLAYGALTSVETVQAWMNSPGHRANILNTAFSEVGFGFANSPDYQSSGQQTVVVAMYAKPYAAPAPPAPPKPPVTAPAPKPRPAPAPVSQAPVASRQPTAQPRPSAARPETVKEAPLAQPVDESTDEADTESDNDEKALPTAISKDGNQTVIPDEDTKEVRRIELMTGNHAGVAVLGSVMAGTSAMGAFLYRHSKAWHRRIIKGEQFIIKHPLVDIVALAAVVIIFILLQSVARVL